MGVVLSVVAASIADLVYDLAIAGIAAITYVTSTVAAVAVGAATLAIDIGYAVVPYALAAIPFLITYAPALALTYFALQNPVLTAAFVFTGIAAGAGAVAATALGTTEANNQGPANPNSGLQNNYRSNEDVQQEFDAVLDELNRRAEFKNELATYSQEQANSRFTTSTGDIVENTFVNRQLDWLNILLQKKDLITEGAAYFVEHSAYLIRDTVNQFRTAARGSQPDFPWSFTTEDLDQRNRGTIRLRKRSREGQRESLGVTLEDFLYGLAVCKNEKKGCPEFITGSRKRKNVSVRNNSRRNKSKREVRVPNRKRVNKRVRSNVNKSRVQKQNDQQGSSNVRKVTKRRRVGKQKQTMRRKTNKK